MFRYTLTFVLLFNAALYAQGLNGRVVSAGSPVAYAPVAVQGTPIGTVTDTLGNFQLNISSGTHKIIVAAMGYLRKEITVNLDTLKNKFLLIDLTEFANPLNEVVVSGTLSEVSRSESPVVVESFGAAFFRHTSSPTLYDAMQMINGVQPQLACNVCQTADIHINGMEGAYTMVTIDGMPIVSGLSSVYGQIGIPASLIERVEVVKGPSSTLYGSEAVGGLINIITKNPNTAPIVLADFSGTSYGEFNTDFAMSYKLKKAAGITSVNYYNYSLPVDRNGDNFMDVTLQNRISVFSKWAFTNKYGQQSGIAVRAIYEDRMGGQMDYKPEHRGTDIKYGESIYTNRYEAIGNFRIPSEKTNLNLQYSYNYHHQNSYYGTTFFLATQQTAFAQLVWQKNIGASHKLTSGLAYRFVHYIDNTPATRGFGEDSLKQIPFLTNQPALFVQDEYGITEKIKLLAGMRFEYNFVHGPIFAPRLNAKFDIGQNGSLRVGVGNGFRVVNIFTEDHAALSGSRQVVITEELKPERSWNGNANYSKMLVFDKGFVNLDAGLFYTVFSNKIIADYFVNPNAIYYQNLRGYGVSRGISANAEVSFVSGLKGRVGVTYMEVYQREENTAGNLERVPQVHAPNWQGVFSVSYTIKPLKLAVDYTGQLYSPMYLPILPADYRPAKSPWFTLQNIQLSRKFMGGKLEVYAGCKNLFNFMPKDPLMRPFDPFDKQVAFDAQGNAIASPNNPNGYTFDTTYGYASMQGRRYYAGIRYELGRK